MSLNIIIEKPNKSPFVTGGEFVFVSSRSPKLKKQAIQNLKYNVTFKKKKRGSITTLKARCHEGCRHVQLHHPRGRLAAPELTTKKHVSSRLPHHGCLGGTGARAYHACSGGTGPRQRI